MKKPLKWWWSQEMGHMETRFFELLELLLRILLHLCELWLRPKFSRWLLYLMLRLMCEGLELLFLVPVRAEGGVGLWLAGLEWGLDPGWEEGGWAGVSAEGEVDAGGVHCHTAGSPPWASFWELKGALWDWSVRRGQEQDRWLSIQVLQKRKSCLQEIKSGVLGAYIAIFYNKGAKFMLVHFIVLKVLCKRHKQKIKMQRAVTWGLQCCYTTVK